jgi:hypothetical protein
MTTFFASGVSHHGKGRMGENVREPMKNVRGAQEPTGSETHSDCRQDSVVVALLSFQEPGKSPVR